MSPAQVIFHPDHDLRLEVRQGQKQASFLVCSRTLATASYVFKRMLFGGFKESKPGIGEWIVSLPDENILGLETVLHIIHMNFQKVTTFTTSSHSFTCDELPKDHPCVCNGLGPLAKLYAVAVTVDKYDLVHILQPWARRWLRRARNENFLPRDCSLDLNPWPRAELAWIAWVFGNEHLLQKQLHRAVLSAFLVETELGSYSDSNEEYGHLSDGTPKTLELSITHEDTLDFPAGDGNPEFDHLFGFLDVADQVKEQRLQLIISLLKPVRSLYQEVVDLYQWCDEFRTQLEDGFGKRSADFSMPLFLGIPLPKAEEYTDTVAYLHSQLDDYLLPVIAVTEEYTELKEATHLKWREIMDNRPCIELSEAEKAHLKRQREKLNIPLDEDYESTDEDVDLD